ncbi:hypothetical protein KP509_18G040700 [Ceratopteris richardii]|uniref:DCD domain-containing protein n=1 Tax=Ceratopteris richardii TaxID=49495 RepID=A0A8T2SSS5_CERRI|nr:hypothetical protein KP509_18G040700 [Ceratopteris richardii]
MGAGRKTETYNGLHSPSSGASRPPSSPLPFLNLLPEELAAVIFGCDHATYNECVTQLLFGLRASHISYVKNVRPGMPLFLFNYIDKKLHGIFEADSYGEMNINPYAWTDGKQKTQFPAQARVRVRCQCAPLTESIYKEALAANYVNYSQEKILFELNLVQTDKLISLFMRNSLSVSRPVVGLQRGSMSGDKGEDVDGWMKPKKPQKATFKAWKNAVAFTPAQNSVYSILEYKGAITPEQQCDDPSNRAKSSSQDFLQKDVEPMAGDSVNWNAAAASSSFNTDEALEEYTKSEKHHERTEKLEVVEALKEQKFKGKQVFGDRTFEDLILQERAHNEPSNSDSVDVPESVEWESLAREQCLQEQTMLRDDREQLKEKLQALDIPVAKAISKNLELSALAIAQMRQDRIKMRQLMDEAMTREELLKELDELRKKNATLEYAQVQMSLESDVLKSDMARMSSELAALKADMARMSLKVEVLSESGKEGSLMPTSSGCHLFNGMAENESALVNGADYCQQIYLIGGMDGSSCLYSVDIFNAGTNEITSAAPLSEPRSYSAACVLMESVYVFGGGNGSLWFNTVEMYDYDKDEWMICAPMSQRKGSLAGVTAGDRIYAIGGGNGKVYFSDVECYDPHLGTWIGSTSMLNKRFGVAATELNGAIYAIGGYDGQYLSLCRFHVMMQIIPFLMQIYMMQLLMRELILRSFFFFLVLFACFCRPRAPTFRKLIHQESESYILCLRNFDLDLSFSVCGFLLRILGLL